MQCLVVFIYDRAGTCLAVYKARKEPYTREGRLIAAVPTIVTALPQQTKRAAYHHTRYSWGQAMVLAARMCLLQENGFGLHEVISVELEAQWCTIVAVQSVVLGNEIQEYW